MARLVVRNLEEAVKAKLRRRAAAHGWSAEEDVRAIVRAVVDAEAARQSGLGTRIAALFTGIVLRDGEEIPELRGYAPRPATFDE
jgi:antitoxin FitA